MVALSSGTNIIIAQSGVTIAAPDTSFIPAAGTYSNQSVTYNLISFTTSYVYFQVNTQKISVSESTTSSQSPNLPCSFSGSTSIDYSLSSYNSATIPSFVSIGSVSGLLSIAAPSVSTTNTYIFSINSTVSGASSPIQTIIMLTVNKWTSNNCKLCSVTNSSICATCYSGYSLSSGNCNLPQSEIAKMLRITNQSVVGLIALLLLILNWAKSSSSTSSSGMLWSIVNQMQILFLLFLTGAFIPKDIESIITGFSISLNPFSYFQLKFNGNYNFVSNLFDFGLENSKLEKLGIYSDSTIVNLTSFVLSIIIIWILHLLIFLIQKLLSKESKSSCWKYVLLGLHWVLNKLVILFTFALYIRTILETNQFILVSWVSEIYHFNYDGTKRIVSLAFAHLVLIAWIALIVITIFMALSKVAPKSSESKETRSKLSQLFDGVSPDKKSRLFISFLLMRRAAFVILLITVEPQSSIVVISILMGLQLIYLGILGFIRPFEMVKCNIIEIVNEMYLLVMFASLLKYNTIANWEGTPTTVYTWFMSSNYYVSFFIIFGK